jgi:hypothetical protein
MTSFAMSNSSAVESYISNNPSQSAALIDVVSSLLSTFPVATWYILLENVAVFTAGIRAGDPVWTLGGQLPKKITTQSKFRSTFWFLRIQDLVSRLGKDKHNALFSHKPSFLSTIVVKELPFYAVANWIHRDWDHRDWDHLWQNMFLSFASGI